MRILIVEDEQAIRDLLRMNLTKAGYECITARDGKEGADLIEECNFDLILLDIMLPYINGYELMEYIRPLGIPVIFITAKGELSERVKGLTSGAEDYIVKPFEVVELLARIRIVMRRYHKLDMKLMFRDIEVDVENQRAVKNGVEIFLTPKEFELLVFLMRNRNITLFREKIYEEIWGSEYPVESRTLDLHIQRLRHKLGLSESLRTIFKTGYRLEETP